jgi:hypothetical protein
MGGRWAPARLEAVSGMMPSAAAPGVDGCAHLAGWGFRISGYLALKPYTLNPKYLKTRLRPPAGRAGRPTHTLMGAHLPHARARTHAHTTPRCPRASQYQAVAQLASKVDERAAAAVAQSAAGAGAAGKAKAAKGAGKG